MSISVPFNPDMRGGQMIEVKLPLKKSDDQEQTDYGSDRDNDISGKYLVSELKHRHG